MVPFPTFLVISTPKLSSALSNLLLNTVWDIFNSLADFLWDLVRESESRLWYNL